MRDAILNLPASRIREVARLGMGRSGVIPLWFGEPDVPTPQFICDAAAAGLAAGDTFYTPNRGTPELRDAIAEYMTGLYRRPIDVDAVTVTVSGMNAIMIALQCLIEPGARLVTVSPLWPNLVAVARILGARVEEVPLTPAAGGWTLDAQRLIDACGDDAAVILLNSPSNPTGWMMHADAQRAVLDHARRHGAWVVADEVYARIVYDRPVAPSFVEAMADGDRLIVINSFSKSWAMTGWRLGWITAPPAVGPVLEKMMEFNIAGAAGFVQRAGLTAIRDGEDFVSESVARYRANRELFLRRIADFPRVTAPPPEAAFYCFFRVDGVADGVAFAKRILAETGVGLAPGEAFGDRWAGWLRLCLAASHARLEEALDRLAPVLG